MMQFLRIPVLFSVKICCLICLDKEAGVKSQERGLACSLLLPIKAFAATDSTSHYKSHSPFGLISAFQGPREN